MVVSPALGSGGLTGKGYLKGSQKALAFLPPSPNPAQGPVRLAFALPSREERVDLAIHDLAGRANHIFVRHEQDNDIIRRDLLVVHPVLTPDDSPLVASLDRSIHRVLGRSSARVARTRCRATSAQRRG